MRKERNEKGKNRAQGLRSRKEQLLRTEQILQEKELGITASERAKKRTLERTKMRRVN